MELARDVRRKLELIGRLAKRGAWKGVRLFTKNLLWGLTHTRCRQCSGRKGISDGPVCHRCGTRNIYRALFEEDSNV